MVETRPPSAEGENTSNSLDDIRVPLERFGRLLSTAAILFIVAYAAGVSLVLSSGYLEGDSRQVDFVALWAAAKLAVAGDPAMAFDQEVLRSAQLLPPDSHPNELYWLYPPAMLLLLAPLGLLPYWVAWLVFIMVSLTAFTSAMWRFAGAVPMGRSLLLGAPAVLITMQLGQVSLLWSAGLFVALRAMAQGQPVIAGLLIAMLSLKPQLGLLIPFVLVAGKRWDVLLWTGVGAFVIHVLPTLYVGVEYWISFFDIMKRTTSAMGADTIPHHLMITPYAFSRFLGLPHLPSTLVQVVLSLSLALGVIMLWRRRSGNFDLLAGSLLVAMPIATPYAFYYELTLLIPAAIFLVRGGYGAKALDRILLAIIVFGPAGLWFVSTSSSLATLFAPVILVVFARSFMVVRQSVSLTPDDAAHNPSPLR
ncbi:MAG: glycosyltransferase family 87 protein [Alphaproteobacteria bacterium]